MFHSLVVFETGPLPPLPSKLSDVFLRTIYLWHTIAIFTKDKTGDYMKPTEGLDKKAAKAIRSVCRKNGGCWIWFCSSKSTDIEKGKKQRSYCFGAAFVRNVITTKKFNQIYQKQRLKAEYKHSSEYKYQAIIPSNEYARLELRKPVEVHSPVEGECRWKGMWNMNKKATQLAKALQNPVFAMV